ncbi:hypothetical protein PENTCL1PPCAC_24300 [Pristionchus entomophagus]|uniref:Uncharacterized protein n=1 Tax=Pristionchus entomophagus TaxID=358040 RepID=A0AAV5U5H0_9BILA|nr:hypothetical protein PENTCL1PPCAC_24300 [Pristionchus entomophagus]
MDNEFNGGSFVIIPLVDRSISSQLELCVKVKGSDVPLKYSIADYRITRVKTEFQVELQDGSFKTLTELVQSCAENSSKVDLTFSIEKNK